MPKQIFENTLFLCADCQTKSGYGQAIPIRYSNTGGYSPKWEGRICQHLTAEVVLAHLKPSKKEQQ